MSARGRYFLIAGVRIAAALGGVLGVALLARAHDWPTKVLGGAIVLSAMYFGATVPLALAQRWRSPPE